MTSASTKKRAKRKAGPPKTIPGLAYEFMREMMKPPGSEDYGAAFRRARSAGDKDAEVQRLRAAMAHAVDECESALQIGAHGLAYAHVLAALTTLKEAL